MTKVAICIPSGDMLHADMAMALAALTNVCASTKDGAEQIELALLNVKASLIVYGRSDLVHEAQKLGVDYLFFIDSDIVVHPARRTSSASRRTACLAMDSMDGRSASRYPTKWLAAGVCSKSKVCRPAAC
jgi:long-subunit acyl-CoA synthetase (AMP-forming)